METDRQTQREMETLRPRQAHRGHTDIGGPWGDAESKTDAERERGHREMEAAGRTAGANRTGATQPSGKAGSPGGLGYP